LAELLAATLTSAVVRDAAIQRFEYSFEATWKAAQAYLREGEGIEVGSPKSTVRQMLQVGIFSEADARLALAMADDRNLTVHAYNAAIAEAIAQRLSGYASLMQRWIEAMTERLEAT
jgi:nucleotidyltransferase substrate binding protein (TIGR01987 family)